MRTAEICPTCATYTNALCVLYDGPDVLTYINVNPLNSLDTALVNINTAVGAINIAIDNLDLDEVLSNGNTSLLDAGVGALNIFSGSLGNFGRVAFGSDTFTFLDSNPNDIFSIKDSELNIFSNAGTIAGKITSSALSTSRTFNLPDNSGTIALTSDIPVVPQKCVIFISQSGISTPTGTVAFNTLSGVTISFSRITAGVYQAIASGPVFLAGKTVATIFNSTTGNAKFTQASRSTDTVIFFKTYNAAGILTDSLLDGTDVLQIEVYP